MTKKLMQKLVEKYINYTN